MQAYIYIYICIYIYPKARYTHYYVGIGIFHSDGLVVVAYKPSTVNLVVELFMRSISNANVQQCHASFGCNFVILSL
jgi:hypothetical protein